MQSQFIYYAQRFCRATDYDRDAPCLPNQVVNATLSNTHVLSLLRNFSLEANESTIHTSHDIGQPYGHHGPPMDLEAKNTFSP